MRYTLDATTADLALVDRALADIDPAALCDFDAEVGVIRIFTLATHSEVLSGLHQAGMTASPGALTQQPTECCGGCGG